MHLLNVHNRTLEDFVGSIPSYAILSHTWGKNEITYQDIRNPASVAYKAGWTKINGACSLAGEDGYDHIWIDTCCTILLDNFYVLWYRLNRTVVLRSYRGSWKLISLCPWYSALPSRWVDRRKGRERNTDEKGVMKAPVWRA